MGGPGPTNKRKRREVLTRPHWMKSLRCQTASATSCTECTDVKSCWKLGPDFETKVRGLVVPRTVVVPSKSLWVRFVNKLHVHCSKEYMWIVYRIEKVERGTLRFFWDGRELCDAGMRGCSSLGFKPGRLGATSRLSIQSGEEMTSPVNAFGAGHDKRRSLLGLDKAMRRKGNNSSR